MLDIIKDKKFIFFDVGYTLDRPLSGDWQFTKKFYDTVKGKLDKHSKEEIYAAYYKGIEYFKEHHLMSTLEDEYDVVLNFYKIVSDELNLNLTEQELKDVAYDRTYNMNNYVIYDGVIETLTELSKKFRMGVISDTCPSMEPQLKHIGVHDFFETYTYSYVFGVFKPDPKMFIDALNKCGCKAEETVFIDDQVGNLKGAEKFGITPILIAANPASDVETEYTKIYSIKDLLK